MQAPCGTQPAHREEGSMNTLSFAEKVKFVRDSGLSLNELRQILHEMEQEAAEAEADYIGENL